MEPKKVFKFCPRCSGDLAQEKDNLLVCAKCGFEFYLNAVPCNAAIIENEKGEIMLVKRADEPKKGLWDLPGGFINGGEEFYHSVKREIKEELGVDIKIKKIVGVYGGNYEFQGINAPTFGVVVSADIISGTLKASDDISGYKFFPKNKVLKQDLAFENIRRGISDYIKNF